MQKNADLYDLTQNTQGALYQAAFAAYLNGMTEDERHHHPPPPMLLQLRGGYAESPGWLMVQMMEFDPEPLTVEKFRKRAVYSAPGLTRALLELMASEKWLDRKGEEYFLTDNGREIIQRIRDNRYNPFVNFAPLPADEIQRLENLMRHVINACLEANDPPGTWCIAHSRNRAPKDDAPPLSKIIQYGGDLNAFRDDAHMAAFRSYDVTGKTWEAFNFVVNGVAQSADDLFDQLAYRGFTRSEWANSLADLVQRGWIEVTDDKHKITETGKIIHEAVETKTDEYFYAPWNSLTDGEFNDLVALMQKLMDSCVALLEG